MGKTQNSKSIFISLLIFYSLFALAIIGKNSYNTLKPKAIRISKADGAVIKSEKISKPEHTQAPEIDVGPIRRRLRGAGLKPHEARYYKVLDK